MGKVLRFRIKRPKLVERIEIPEKLELMTRAQLRDMVAKMGLDPKAKRLAELHDIIRTQARKREAQTIAGVPPKS